MEKTQLVFVPAPGIGHLVSTVEFSKRLTERDDRLSIVVLVISSISAKKMESYTERVAASNTAIQFINIPQADPPSAEFLKSPENYHALFMENHKSHVKKAIVDLVSQPYTSLAGIVVDLFCSSMIELANELGVPSYVFFTCSAAILGFVFYLPIHYNQIGREFETSDSDSIIPTYSHPVPTNVVPSFAFNKYGGYASSLKHATRFKETKGIIVNTFAELEPHAVNQLKSDSETPPIYTAGPLLDLEGKRQDSDCERIMKWLDDQPPSSVVFLCFGSMGSFEPDQLAEMAIAIERSGYRFLWAVRSPPSKDDTTKRMGEYSNLSEVLPEGFLERTENRGLLCGWAPQMEVLAHEAVGGFVSHCGWNSTLESLWYGVPVATWPLYAEQQINAFELVRELGLALELKLDYRTENAKNLVMAEEIEKAIRCLMDSENPIRGRVKEMKEMSRKAIQNGGSSFISVGRFIEDIHINKANKG
ncbi:UDP-glycosyltransferase 71K1-like [Coffea eugenioides]|uniref:UDP-glycosyltransferase 71K1-like n=1 Tax=Coffea eugenioides TaxID=49369 RepID=UPI000F6102AB|nr:UDP-glycosyltransferase 71K1-like [Coffea eugenioides]